MRLNDLDRTDRRDLVRYSHYVTRVPDEAGREEFELTIAGSSSLVEEVFADANFELRINSAQDDRQVRELVEAANPEHRRSMWEVAGLTDIDQLLKPGPARPDRRTSVFASARPVSGTGTPFFFSVGPLFVPTGLSLFFLGSWVLGASGAVRPVSGDQDLFLRWFSPTGPVMASSTLGGTAPDTAWTTFPFFPWVPVFQVFGFAAGVCGNFTAVGA